MKFGILNISLKLLLVVCSVNTRLRVFNTRRATQSSLVPANNYSAGRLEHASGMFAKTGELLSCNSLLAIKLFVCRYSSG
jgi:hypothetical protein